MRDERTADFARLLEQVLGNLRIVIGTGNDVLCFTSSTTGAFEGAVQNLFSPGDRVLVLDNGAFGARWTQMCRAFGLDVVELTAPWGEQVPADVVAATLAGDPLISAAICVHCETSTGVVTDLRAFGTVARNVLTVVDSASGLGACEMRADEWGIDVVVGGTQKALMAPPGVSFVSVSERAWRRHRTARLPRFYFDWTFAQEGLAGDVPRTPWTPAISVLVQLDVALAELLEEGLGPRMARHRALGRMARAGLQELGLTLLTPDADDHAVVTAAWVPENVDAGQVVAEVADRYGVQLASGNGHLARRILRIGHCGHTDGFDVLIAVAAVEAWLRSSGFVLSSRTTAVTELFTDLSEAVAAEPAVDRTLTPAGE
ncbi:alanine--glyoxylate aminotransferase family protein [Amycolatopsis sp. H6(2020)]|nr:alanine--glyoxylate aminotransferase family protein [Amycolatopsis sp. H6(2020)]